MPVLIKLDLWPARSLPSRIPFADRVEPHGIRFFDDWIAELTATYGLRLGADDLTGPVSTLASRAPDVIVGTAGTVRV